ncbi:MAG: hypothetical protein R3Y29_05065 [bacterium]
MNKLIRQKGEKLLIQWGDCMRNINVINNEIERLNSQLSIFFLNQSISNNDNIKVYQELLEIQQLNLKKMLSNYIGINSIILELEDYKQQVIKLRYINKYSWKAISIKVHVSVRTCFNIKNQVILKILSRNTL